MYIREVNTESADFIKYDARQVRDKQNAQLCQCDDTTANSWWHILPPTKEEVNAFARVCLSVC